MSNQTSRRFFLHKAASSIGLALSAPAIAALVCACETDETPASPQTGNTYTVDISTIPELSTVGGIVLKFVSDLNNSKPVFISRIAENTFAVFSSICTHQRGNVRLPQAPGKNIICSLHNAEFSPVDGSVRGQPAASGMAMNLPRFASTYNSATMILTITA